MGKQQLSVVVPAYNEVGNIRPLCTRLFATFDKEGLEGELLVMDDESHGSVETKAIVEKLQKEGYAIRGHFRTKEQVQALLRTLIHRHSDQHYVFTAA
jgi:dolichol-phosphate mannosyltransferase